MLRDVTDSDVPIFFQHQRNKEARHIAAFTSKNPEDKEAYHAHWERLLASETVRAKTIVIDEVVAGHVASFEQGGGREITYWIDRACWRRGIATRALTAFLHEEEVRPVYARVAKDNPGSIRVLQKCGFKEHGEDKGFANARGAEIEEFIFRLE